MGKKVVLVILDQFADWEGAFITNALMSGEISQGNEVLWASTDREPKRSIGRMTVIPDITLDEIPEDADALLLIGGDSWRKDVAKQVVDPVKSFRSRNKLVGFICDATYFAAANGFLNDVEHTGNDPEALKKAPGYTGSDKYILDNAVLDQGIVTANGNSPVDFATLILEELKAADPEDIRMWTDFYSIGYINALRKYGFIEYSPLPDKE